MIPRRASASLLEVFYPLTRLVLLILRQRLPQRSAGAQPCSSNVKPKLPNTIFCEASGNNGPGRSFPINSRGHPTNKGTIAMLIQFANRSASIVCSAASRSKDDMIPPKVTAKEITASTMQIAPAETRHRRRYWVAAHDGGAAYGLGRAGGMRI